MKKIVIITNIPSPYRVVLFRTLQDNHKEYSLHFVFSGSGEDEREWNVDIEGLNNCHFLESKRLAYNEQKEKKIFIISNGIKKLLNEVKPNVVIGCEYNTTAVTSFLWSKFHRIPFISLTDGTLFSERNFSRIKKMLRMIVIPRADRCIASSTKSKELQLYYGAKEQNITSAILTVDVEKYMCERNEYHSRKLLYVGSLIPRKGLDLLIAALERVETDFELSIVGNGPEKEKLVRQISDSKLDKKIHFIPFVQSDELRKIYWEHDIFILPTREDCFGLVINEAMAASMPILSSIYADGAYDLVKEGENGYLFDPEKPDVIADILNNMLGNDEIVRYMGMNSFKRIQEFTPENEARGYIEAIEKVLGL